MSQTNEILEISQWLLSNGFEPDEVISGIQKLEYSKSPNSDPSFLKEYMNSTYQNTQMPVILPYFTLNRVLELLPDSIDGYDFEYNKRLQYIAYKRHIDAHTIEYHKIQQTWTGQEEKEIETRALRLLRQVVEAGYLSNNSNDYKGGE